MAALDAGCRRIVLGVGGSANTDGGAGMLAALGVRLLDAEGRPVPDGGGGLTALVTVDIDGLDPRLADTELVLAADVTNPLLGDQGAAAIFGPQKGASPADVVVLDDNLSTLVEALAAAAGDPARVAAGQPGAGAAGGVGYAALFLGATRRPGIDVVMDLVDLDRGARRGRRGDHRRGQPGRPEPRAARPRWGWPAGRAPRRTRPCWPSADAPPWTTPSAAVPVSTGSGR